LDYLENYRKRVQEVVEIRPGTGSINKVYFVIFVKFQPIWKDIHAYAAEDVHKGEENQEIVDNDLKRVHKCRDEDLELAPGSLCFKNE
jgi:hypothetical protein